MNLVKLVKLFDPEWQGSQVANSNVLVSWNRERRWARVSFLIKSSLVTLLFLATQTITKSAHPITYMIFLCRCMYHGQDGLSTSKFVIQWPEWVQRCTGQNKSCKWYYCKRNRCIHSKCRCEDFHLCCPIFGYADIFLLLIAFLRNR